MAKQTIISISREFGSGGHEIAEKIAQHLGLKFYDRSMLDEIANKLNVKVEVLEKYDEAPRNFLMTRRVGNHTNSMAEILAEYQFDFIRDKAASGESFVIVGRCSETVLKNHDCLISIFVNGDREHKLARVKEKYQLSARERAVIEGALCPLTTFSISREADYRAEDITEERRPGFLGSRFTVSGPLAGEFPLDMPGKFNVENALAALAAADMAGIGREAVAKGLETVQVKGRTQILPTPGHYTLLIDYAHNAVSTENLLSMLRAYRPHRLICLFGGGGNRSRLRRYDMGEMSAKYADLTVLTMDNPRDEEVEAINEDIKVGLARHDGKYISIPDRADAIHWVIDHAQDGDIIALIGKGHEEYQEIRGVKHFFSEEQVVLDYLNSHK